MLVRFRFLAFITGALLALGGSPLAGQDFLFENEEWHASYVGSAMPEEPWQFYSQGDATAKVVDGALLMSDLGRRNGERVFCQYIWRADAGDELTVAACVKVVSCDGVAGNCIVVANGVNEDMLTLYPDRIVLEKAKLSYNLDTTKAFLTYRIIAKGEDIRVFVNEQMVIDGRGKFTNPAHGGRNLMVFGAGNSPATAEAHWKQVAFRKAGRDADPMGRKGTVRMLRQQIIVQSEEDVNFPAARRLSDGTIFLSYSVGTHTVNERGGRLISRDNGKTWEAPTKQIPSSALVEMPDKGFIAVSAWRTKPIRGKNVHPLTVYRSPDSSLNGLQTWKAELEFPYEPDDYGILVHRSLVRMPNGDLIGTGYGQPRVESPSNRCYCYISSDEGKTWKYHSTIIAGKSPGPEGFNEPVLVLLRNGDLLCHVRTGGPLLQVRSKDGGKTWTEPKEISDHGVDPDLIHLSNGAVVTSYGRPGVSIKVDFDGTGEKWDRTLDVYKGPGCSYTSLVEIEPGLVMLFYTESSFCASRVGFYPLNRLVAVYMRIEPRSN